VSGRKKGSNYLLLGTKKKKIPKCCIENVAVSPNEGGKGGGKLIAVGFKKLPSILSNSRLQKKELEAPLHSAAKGRKARKGMKVPKIKKKT